MELDRQRADVHENRLFLWRKFVTEPGSRRLEASMKKSIPITAAKIRINSQLRAKKKKNEDIFASIHYIHHPATPMLPPFAPCHILLNW